MQSFPFNFDNIPPGMSTLIGMNIIKFGALFYLQQWGHRTFVWVGKVSRLFVFPVKSCRGIEVDELTITRSGSQYGHVKDRHWMIIHGDGSRCTQRTQETLALVSQTLKDDKLLLDAPGMETLVLETKPDIKVENITECVLSGKSLKVLDCGAAANRWLRQYLGREDVRLVHLPSSLDSMDCTQFNKPHHFYARKGDVRGLHDKAPFMLMTQASLDAVDARVPGQNIDVTRFRPNILVDGDEAFDEDNWARVQIGDGNLLTRIAMCTRCIFVTVDQENPNKPGSELEPLASMRTYRLAPERNSYGRSPVLGVHLCPDKEIGTLRVGDDVLAVKEHY